MQRCPEGKCWGWNRCPQSWEFIQKQHAPYGLDKRRTAQLAQQAEESTAHSGKEETALGGEEETA